MAVMSLRTSANPHIPATDDLATLEPAAVGTAMVGDDAIWPPLADWQNPERYAYTRELGRDAWAWEFLRRNPLYRAGWARFQRDKPVEGTAVLQRFGIITWEDPARTSLDAKVLWDEHVSRFVLPLRAEHGRNDSSAPTLDLSGLRAWASVSLAEDPVQHVLFVESGRRLQLAVSGDDLFGQVRLLADAPLDVTSFKWRMMLLHRLAHLVRHERFPERLYPPDPRGRRLAVILRALDGWLAKTSQRRIGEAILEGQDIDRDWRNCPCELRDRVRLTLRRGRWLMDGGYRTLLQ